MSYQHHIPTAGAENGRSQQDQSNLTRSQYLIWLGQKLNPHAPLYNMVHTFTMTGDIDPVKFRQAFQTLIDRSDALRTVIEEIDETPRQRVLANLSYEMAYLDFSANPDPQASLRVWLDLRRLRVLDMAGCLFDAALIKMGPSCYVWYLNQHHLITDVLSFALTYRHMAAFYQLALEGRLAEAPRLPAYQEYVAYARTPPPAKQAEKAAAYWTNKLATPFEPTDFYGRTLAERKPRARRVPYDLGRARSERLRAVARQKGIQALTPDMSLLNIFTALLATLIRRVGGKRQISLGVPFHNRPKPVFKETMGLFINVLPLHVAFDADETFRSLIQKCRTETLTTLRYPLPHLNSAGKAYDVVLNYLTASFPDFNGMPVQNEWLHPGYGDGNHALRLQIHDFEDEGNFMLYFDMNCAVFDETRRRQIIQHFLRILDGFLDNPDQRIGQIDLLSKMEKQRYLLDFNQTATPYPADKTVVQLFEAQVDRTPDAIALQDGAAALTYAQLNRRANQLAHYLRAQGVGPDRPVALCLDRSFEAVIGMLGILKAGGAYVPLDPAYPPDRLAFMLADTQAPVLLAKQHLVKNLPGHQARTLYLDADWKRVAGLPETNPTEGAAPRNLAYIIHTSGSTGRPKGAMIEHRGLANYVCWAAGRYTHGEALTFPLFTSLSFDLTVTSIYVPLISGGRVLIYGEDDQLVVLKIIEADSIDVIKLTPAHLSLVKTMTVQATRLKRMIVGGEDFKRDLARTIHEQFGGRLEIYNEYGPTETVVGCMIHRFDPDRDTGPSVPVGVPVANARIYVLDEQRVPTPTGVVGEIFIAGDGVARGYLNRPDLTGQRFLPDPFSGREEKDGRLYRTGDLARWTGSGRLEFLGRADHQVKIKGVRIELGEIEAALLAHEAIREAIVDVVHRETGPDRPADIRRCRRCGLPSTYPGATFDQHDVCHTCRDFEKHQARVQPYFKTPDDLRAILDRAKATKTGQYDCLALLSGGKDSTYMLYQLVREMGATPLAFSLDNGYISEQAKANIRRVTGDLGVDLVFGQTPHMNAIFVDSLNRHSNVCNGCFKTIYTLSMQLAHEKGINYIITGLARGQLFETRLADMFEARVFDAAQIDHTVLEARKAYHRLEDAVSQRLDTSLFQDDSIFDAVHFIDFYRYTAVQLHEMYDYLHKHAPWIRPEDTGRSTNCLINEAGIYIHQKQRGYHNYALPYSWDVRLGHKTRSEALDELDDDIDEHRVRRILQEIGYQEPDPSQTEKRLAAYYVADSPLTPAALKSYLAQSLPEAMLPFYFTALPAMPLTQNGKVDRQALPPPDKQPNQADALFVAPQTPRQQTLADIWAAVFRLERVGVNDNFFDLGGDSIISIQIIAKAGQAGLRLTAQQLFAHQTVAELAEVAGVETVEAEQGLVAGRVPLTPIQHWFFEQDLPNPDHWNQALLIDLPAGINIAWLERAVQQLPLHHDALRLRFERTETGLRQVNTMSAPPVQFLEIDLAGLSTTEATALRQRTMATLETGHDLAAGRLIQAAVFHKGSDQPDQLFLTSHHLAVDGVSWQTLLQDIETIYYQLSRREAITLPPKTTSFKHWAEGLLEYVQSDALQSEAAYWSAVTQGVEPAIPTDYAPAAANTEASTRLVSIALTSEETSALLKDVAAAYNTQINDALLTALARTLAPWTGRRSLLINLEGHGREEILEAVDLSRTVGWFTSLFPVNLTLPENDHPGEALKAIKEQLRRIPQRGIGYGLLRYLSRDEAGRRLAAQPEAPVLFNYLGQFDRVLPDSDLFRLNHELIGSHDPQGRRRHLLDINTFVINGRLQMDWTYSENIHRGETIRRLADTFAEALRLLIAHCLSPDAGGFTPSDFPLAELTQAQLDRILAVDRRVEDIYPLSSLQQGMLFHTLYAPQSGMYLLQFSGLLPPDIDVAAFEQAWREAVRRHAVLRTRFVWQGLEQPLQVVHATARLPFEVLDWRDLSPQEQETGLQRLREDRWRGFDLGSPPLMNIILVRLSERQYRFIWNFHHLLFDRWSMSPLLQDVFALYAAIRRQQPLPPKQIHRYRDYIAWVAKQDLRQAETFWRTRLNGFTRPTPLLNDRNPDALPGEVADYGRETFTLSVEDTAELKRVVRGHRLTVNTFIQGAWGLLLSYWSGRTDVVFGSITPGRPADLPGSETIAGLFMNTLPARVQIDPEANLLDWLRDHQQDQVAMRRFDYSPLVLVQGWSDAPGGTSLFDSIIGVQSASPNKPSLLTQAEAFGLRDFDLVDWNSLPLSLAVDVEAQVMVVMKYARHRFDDPTGRQMARHFKQLLEAMIRRPTATLQALLAEADQTQQKVRQKSKARSLKQTKRKSITL